MARIPRLQTSRLQYHLTVHCSPGPERVLQEEDFWVYLQLLRLVKGKHQISIFNYELMPDQVQLFIKPSPQVPLSKTMHLINWSFARHFNRRKKLKGHFWLERYESCPIERGENSLEMMREMHHGPVLAGLAEEVGAWNWSGYSAMAEGASNEILTLHPDYLALGITSDERKEQYRQWVNKR